MTKKNIQMRLELLYAYSEIMEKNGHTDYSNCLQLCYAILTIEDRDKLYDECKSLINLFELKLLLNEYDNDNEKSN